MNARTPITLALLIAAIAAPAAQPAGHVSTTLDPAIAAAIRSHEMPQSAVPLIAEHSAGQNRLDPAIATAMRSHETAHAAPPLITENSAGQHRLEPSAAPTYGGLDPAIATAMRSHETAQPVPPITASNGFDWMAAGLGATVAFAAMLLGLAAARFFPRRGRALPA